MQRLLLVDGHSNLYRAFYAIRAGLTAPDGTPTNAAFGFLRMQHKLLRDVEPDAVAVVFDAAGETFRNQLDERYKANRPPMPEDLAVQIPVTMEALQLLGVAVLSVEGVEADDVIGTLARTAAGAGMEVVIASSDKDLMQLVRDPSVRMWHTSRERLLDEAGVEEVFGVPPERVVEMLALMGDSSDNVPGCKGIGAKGAKDLVTRWGTVATMYEHLEEITPPRARTALEAHRAEVELSRRLVTIDTAVPIDVELAALGRGEADLDALADHYRRMGATSLLDELGERRPVAASAPVAVRRVGPQSLADVFEGEHDVALDLAPDGVAVAAGGDDLLCVAPLVDVAAALGARLARCWCPDAKAFVAALRDAGVEPAAVPRDAALAGYVLAPGERVDLPTLSERYGVTVPLAERPETARARAVAELAPRLRRALDEQHLATVFSDIEMPLVQVLEGMERRGIQLDPAVLDDLRGRLESSLAELERDIHGEAGGPFNINSPQQLAEVMFDRGGLPVLRRTRKTKAPSTDADVLVELAGRGYRLPALIIEYREQAKLKSTYVDALPRQIGPDGRIHTTFNQTVAATGRLSSSEPNLQNIPIRTELGREVRRAFVAAPGRRLLAADYSQIELRVLAHLSRDPGLLEAFTAGEDIHTATAALVFGVHRDLVTSDQRRAAKTINFGLIYGMSAFALGRELGVPQKEAQSFIDAYFRRLPRVLGFMEQTRQQARDDGKVSTLFGRVRWIAGLDARSPQVRGNAERMAMNAPIQGTAADLIKLAMIELARRLAGDGAAAALLLQVHDELVLEVAEAEAEAVADTVRAVMENVADLSVPLRVDVGIGGSWAEAKG